jgi:hypothetical protein
MRRTWAVTTMGALVAGALLLATERGRATYLGHVGDADAAFARGDLEPAARRYEAAQREYGRRAWLLRELPWRRGLEPDRLLLQLGNVRYRQAEALLAKYGRARRDPEVAERPSVEAIHRRFAEARRRYEQVSPTDPALYGRAQFNAAHAAAMEFLVDLWSDRAKSVSALRGDLVRLIRRTAAVVDHANAQRLPLPREDRMAPTLLLERLTQFSQEPKRPDDRPDGAPKLGDFLRVSPPRVSDAERRLLEKFLLEREEPVQAGEGEEGGLH